MWFWKIIRRFFLSIDSVLFNFIDVLYDLLMSISRTSILTQGEIAQFAQRIELLLGIFMLFKLSFSLITYIVNPDDLSDKQKGFGKLIQSAVVSLLMIVLVPYIFQLAYNLQAKILEGNVLAKLILGEDNEASGEDNFLNTAGEEMAFSVMLPFFKPNYSINDATGADLGNCINIYEKDADNNNVFSHSCKEALKEAGMETTPLENYSNGITERSLGLTFRIDAALATTGDADTDDDDKEFIIDYMSPISTVVAVVVCLLLVTFCIDIGVRNVKLAFLQLIYPIPVISYMDPKSGKDGLFKKWYQMCLSTFLSLFVRLLALYFGVYIIAQVGSLGVYDVVNGSQITNGWVQIFVIIGVLMFVKQLPKILENLGIKLDGGFTLNPLKKLEDGIPGGKKIIGGTKRVAKGAALAGVAGAAAFGSNALTAASRIRNAEGARGKLRAITGTFSGGLSAMRRGATAGLKNEKLGKGFTNSYSEAMEQMKKEQQRADDGIGKMSVRKAKAQKAMGMQTKGERVAKEQERLKKIQDNYKNIKDTAIATDRTAKALSKEIDTIKRTAPDVNKYNLSNPIEKANYDNDVKLYNAALDAKEKELDTRIQELAHGDDKVINSDGSVNAGATNAIANLVSDMDSIIPKANRAGSRIDSDYADITETASSNAKVASGQATGASTQISSSEKAQKATTIDNYAGNGKK